VVAHAGNQRGEEDEAGGSRVRGQPGLHFFFFSFFLFACPPPQPTHPYSTLNSLARTQHSHAPFRHKPPGQPTRLPCSASPGPPARPAAAQRSHPPTPHAPRCQAPTHPRAHATLPSQPRPHRRTAPAPGPAARTILSLGNSHLSLASHLFAPSFLHFTSLHFTSLPPTSGPPPTSQATPVSMGSPLPFTPRSRLAPDTGQAPHPWPPRCLLPPCPKPSRPSLPLHCSALQHPAAPCTAVPCTPGTTRGEAGKATRPQARRGEATHPPHCLAPPGLASPRLAWPRIALHCAALGRAMLPWVGTASLGLCGLHCLPPAWPGRECVALGRLGLQSFPRARLGMPYAGLHRICPLGTSSTAPFLT
jgi:hypothetical protein